MKNQKHVIIRVRVKGTHYISNSRMASCIRVEVYAKHVLVGTVEFLMFLRECGYE